jgi:hypothetical protein
VPEGAARVFGAAVGGACKSAPVAARADWLYIDLEGTTQGPFALSAMRGWHAGGYLPRGVMVRRVGQHADFLPVEDCAELRGPAAPEIEYTACGAKVHIDVSGAVRAGAQAALLMEKRQQFEAQQHAGGTAAGGSPPPRPPLPAPKPTGKPKAASFLGTMKQQVARTEQKARELAGRDMAARAADTSISKMGGAFAPVHWQR